MHIAIENGHIQCCFNLLEKEVDLTIKNKDLLTPLYYCIKFSKPKILDLILNSKPELNINVKDYNGATMLHYCAFTDNLECAKILLQHGAKICTASDNGCFPIHVAAFRCSNNVLNLLLEEGKKLGCSKEKMLKFTDADDNRPLHTAVQFCNSRAVKLCLENGSKIDEKNEIDHSTPIHVACAQGSLDILIMMLEKQPELKDNVIHMKDLNEMTPLHKASMFDHVEVAEYLLKNGSDINAIDEEKRSPLLLAASRNCVKVVCFLLEKNAKYKLKDMRLRNFLHLIVSHTKPIQSLVPNTSATEKELPLTIEGSHAKAQNTTISIHSLHEISKVLIKVKFT